MIARVVSIGVYPQQLPRQMVFEFQKPYTVEELIEEVKRHYQVDLLPDLLTDEPGIVLLYKGRNIFMGQGLSTELEDQEELFISVVMSGG